MTRLQRSISSLLLLASAALLPTFALAQPPPYKYLPPTKINDGIRAGTLRSAKIDEAKIVAGINEILKGTYSHIHSLLIFRHGKLVSESYFTGEDENNHKGKIGVVAHSRETLHDMRSVSKTVVGLAVLIAHSKGIIKGLDEPIHKFFPEYAKHFQGEKRNITIRHALTMTPGFEWNERGSYADPANTAYQMNVSADRVEFLLSRNIIHKPGTIFQYNGGTTQLLAAIIKKTSGSDVENFAKKYLFEPLGIRMFEWARVNGLPDADSGLRLRSRDMAKIGSLIMDRGKWNGEQIIPATLIVDSIKPWVRVSEDADGWLSNYGYQVFLQKFSFNGRHFSVTDLSGNGGQKVMIDHKNSLMIVVTAGNYDATNLQKYSFDILLDIVYPATKDLL